MVALLPTCRWWTPWCRPGSASPPCCSSRPCWRSRWRRSRAPTSGRAAAGSAFPAPPWWPWPYSPAGRLPGSQDRVIVRTPAFFTGNAVDAIPAGRGRPRVAAVAVVQRCGFGDEVADRRRPALLDHRWVQLLQPGRQAALRRRGAGLRDPAGTDRRLRSCRRPPRRSSVARQSVQDSVGDYVDRHRSGRPSGRRCSRPCRRSPAAPPSGSATSTCARSSDDEDRRSRSSRRTPTRGWPGLRDDGPIGWVEAIGGWMVVGHAFGHRRDA